MSWIYIILGARFLYAIVGIAEKYFVSKRFNNPFVYIIGAFFVSILGMLFIPFVDFYFLDFWQFIYVFFAAICFFSACFFYIKAVQLEEITRINLLWNFVAIFSLLGAWLVLGEKLNTNQLLAFIILFLGGFLASLHFRGGNKIRFSVALIWMIASCALFATHDIIIHHLTQSVSFFVLLIYTSVLFPIFSLMVLLLSSNLRRNFIAEFKNITAGLASLIICTNMLGKLGVLLAFWAFSLGPIGLINATEGTQVIFVFIIMMIISFFSPKILREELDWKNVLLKLGAMAMVICGVVVLALG